MRRKSLITLVIIMVMLCLSGCGAYKVLKDVAEHQKNKKEAISESTDSASEAADKEREKKRKERENALDNIKDDNDLSEADIYDEYLCGSKRVYHIEESGDLMPALALSDDETIVYDGAGEGYYYVLTRNLSDDNAYSYTLYELTTNTKATPFSDSDNAYIDNACVYNGKFYYTVYDYESGDNLSFYYDISGDAFVSEYELSSLKERLENESGASSLSGNIIYDLATAGKIYMRDDNKLYAYNKDGELINSFNYAEEKNIISFSFYDDCYIIGNYSKYADYETTDRHYVLFDVETGNSISSRIYDVDENMPDIAALKDGYIYYSMNELSETGQTLARTYYREKLDGETFLNTENAQELFTVNPLWGENDSISRYDTLGFMYVYDGFCVKDNACWYLEYAKKDNGYDLVWNKAIMDENDVSARAYLNAVDSHSIIYDYGIVDFVEDTGVNSETGFCYYYGYYESFRLNSQLSDYPFLTKENADEINRFLEDRNDEISAYGREVMDNGEDYYNEMLEYYAENPDDTPYFSHYSLDRNFGGITPIGSKYLQIAFNDYEYWGGAHGYPYLYFYLFDLTSGKSLTLSDLYGGSEEDFKALAAEYSIEDWKENGYDKGYFTEYVEGDTDAENSQYQSFYDSISLDMTMYFSDDGIYIMYPPYDQGPYAAGFIEVFIPYDALDFNLTN